MADDDLKRLRAARGQSKAAITRMIAFKATAEAASSSDADPLLYQQKNDRLEKTFQEYKELNLEISLLDPADSERVEDFEEKYDLLKSFYAGVVNKALDASTSSVSQQPSFSSPGGCNASPFRLPPINLKVFAGEVGEYQSFISLFNSVIDADVKLKACEKLYYLKTYLSGEALALINYLPLTTESYPIAIDLLKQRYDNQKQVVNHHIVSILDLPPMQRASAGCIRNLVSATRQHLGALTNLNAPVSQWDLIVVAILQRKLDQYTLRAYHLENQGNNELPKLHDFLTFLEQRAAALESLGERTPSGRRSSLVASSVKVAKPLKSGINKCAFAGAAASPA
ncbi:uncharacterized protein LOC125229535 isoform X1 [Leguminivora glycinivorella]|uniref:uncharacterized protein LOC125229535 isoform X1 n=1 Tax=Leguminivora glycinivorella TaxID=1035111 RepID=UPI00200FECA6|nr:uncharacterized protein LOC125229535 isoform X1 [Leguminivora glycinivorella]